MRSDMMGKWKIVYIEMTISHSEQGIVQTEVFRFPELTEHFTGLTSQSKIDLLQGR